ncbi:DUF1993 domain-containing protein [Corallococcus exiguus]|uniref:DUF1993 domain-containing protein n=1 Tax=Corallococcus exiguus TaxID=83462 RepID=UPI001494217F|nr:DUF1993 domain-containing protein [Corallococcus exiguus]NPC70491.1 DUF1993 domain-containing protein [Corallococcus exiguus]
MSMNVYDSSAGLFIRGLTNLKTLLTKAEAHIAANGSVETALLDAQLDTEGRVRGVAGHPNDVHMYTLAAQVHWAAEGARLAVANLMGAAPVPAASDEKSFADLYQRLDATIASLREIAPSDLEAGIERAIVIKNRGGSMSFSGSQFLIEFAIPHFFYHVTTAYGILRNQGVHLTMGDFLGGKG